MTLEAIQQFILKLLDAPNYVWAGLMAFICIFVWRKLPRSITVWKFKVNFPNEALWLVGPIVACAVCLLLLPEPPPTGMSEIKWRRLNILLGILIGFGVRLLFVAIVGKLEDKFPSIKSSLEGQGDTMFLTKSLDTPPASPETPKTP